MSKQKLIKRLKSYYPLERFHAFVTFPCIAIYMMTQNPVEDVLFLLYGLLVCILILIQGQHYWKLKLNRLTNTPVDQEKNLRFFKYSKKVNLFLIILIPVVFTIQLFLNDWKIIPNRIMLYSVLANTFAILEHINYYNRQLMIDNPSDLQYVIRNRKLKMASLAKDLRENEI